MRCVQMVVVVGISFNLVIVRVDRGVATQSTYVETEPTIPLRFLSRQVVPNSAVGIVLSRGVEQTRLSSDTVKDDVSLPGVRNDLREV